MKTYQLPQELPVCGIMGPEAWTRRSLYNKVQPTTLLFRANSGLGASMPLAAEAAGDDALEVISAGCSNGAEIDTVLGLARRHLPGRDVRVLGLDQEADILQDAAAGSYYLLWDLAHYRKAYASKGLNFDNEIAGYGMMAAPAPDNNLSLIGTRPLRARYQVDLKQADLAAEVPADRPAHLVACHNVAYHHGPEQASAIAMNLAARVAVGGILSFGIMAERSRWMGNGRDMRYFEWQRQLRSQLDDRGFSRTDIMGTPDLDMYRRAA